MFEYLDLLMFAAAVFLLLRGYPVAFTLGGVGILFALIGLVGGVFDPSFFLSYPKRIFGTMINEVLIAVPLFIFMGVMLERSRVAEELLETMGQLFGSLPGGLGISVSIVGALLAASTGIVGATVVTMGLLSLPTMLKHGYDPKLACGSICAAGTLGQIIPPSIVLVILGDQISNTYQAARLAAGDFSPEPVSVGDLFAGALLPGLALVGMYILYQLWVAFTKPGASPAVHLEDNEKSSAEFLLLIMKALLPPVTLIIAVLGSILTGIATPTEAAAVGAMGAIFLAGIKAEKAETKIIPFQLPIIFAALFSLIVLFLLHGFFDLRITREDIESHNIIAIGLGFIACGILVLGTFVALWRTYKNGVLSQVVNNSTQVTTMVFVILIGASLFSLVFRGLGGEDKVHHFLSNLPGGEFGAIVLVMLVMFVLGFFLDFLEIVFVVVPLVSPALFAMGVDPVWLGVMMAINLQTSFLTPPFGFALFYLRGVAPSSITTGEIYRGVVPFIIIQVLGMILLALFPGLATWLPQIIYG